MSSTEIPVLGPKSVLSSRPPAFWASHPRRSGTGATGASARRAGRAPLEARTAAAGYITPSTAWRNFWKKPFLPTNRRLCRSRPVAHPNTGRTAGRLSNPDGRLRADPDRRSMDRDPTPVSDGQAQRLAGPRRRPGLHRPHPGDGPPQRRHVDSRARLRQPSAYRHAAQSLMDRAWHVAAHFRRARNFSGFRFPPPSQDGPPLRHTGTEGTEGLAKQSRHHAAPEITVISTHLSSAGGNRATGIRCKHGQLMLESKFFQTFANV